MKNNALTGRDLLAALGVVFIWGINFVITKLALQDFTPFQLGAIRFTIAFVPLAFFFKPPAVPWKWVVMYGLFQGVGQFGLMFLSLKVGMTAALASVLLQTQVFFTALFGFFLLHERTSKPQQAGMVLAALGICCFVMNYVNPGASGPGVTTVLGFVLILGAAAMWAVSNIVAKHVQQGYAGYSPISFVVWSSAVAVLPFVLLAALLDPLEARWRWLDAHWISWVEAAYLGLVATLVGYSLWTWLLQRHPANRVSPFGLGVPVVGLATGMIVLGEVITPWQWAGIALTACALGCVVMGGRVAELFRSGFRRS